MNFLKYLRSIKACWIALGAALFPGFAQGAAPSTVNIDEYTFMPYNPSVLAEEGILLLSDSPEYVKTQGIVAGGTLVGDSRIYFYHVNESKEPKKVVVMLENKGTKETKIEVVRQVTGVSHKDYFVNGGDLSNKEIHSSIESIDRWNGMGHIVPFTYTDKKLNKNFHKQQRKRINEDGLKTVRKKQEENTISLLGRYQDTDKVLYIGPGVRKQIALELENKDIKEEELFSGIIDFHATEPVFGTVMIVPKFVDSEKAFYSAEVLPIDEVELRGTFKGLRRLLEVKRTFDTDKDVGAIELANNREDAYLNGVDEITGNLPVKNKGNYGVSNMLVLHTTGEESFAVYFNPLGGGFKGSIKITDGIGKSKIYNLPHKGEYVIGHGTVYDTQLLDIFKGGQDLLIEYMSPGASNLPVRLLLIPLKRLNMHNKDSI